MQDHLRKYARLGLIVSTAILHPIILSDEGHIVDMDKLAHLFASGEDVSPVLFSSNASRNRIRERLHGMIVDMVRLGYI